MAFFFIFLRSIIDIEQLPWRYVSCLWPNFLCQFIDKSNISKCPSCHHFVIASPGPVSMKIRRLNSLRFEIFCRWRILSNIASRGNMISCKWISEPCQNISVFNIFYFWQLYLWMFKKGRVAYICWITFPLM